MSMKAEKPAHYIALLILGLLAAYSGLMLFIGLTTGSIDGPTRGPDTISFASERVAFVMTMLLYALTLVCSAFASRYIFNKLRK